MKVIQLAHFDVVPSLSTHGKAGTVFSFQSPGMVGRPSGAFMLAQYLGSVRLAVNLETGELLKFQSLDQYAPIVVFDKATVTL